MRKIMWFLILAFVIFQALFLVETCYFNLCVDTKLNVAIALVGAFFIRKFFKKL